MNAPEFWAVRKELHGEVRRRRTQGVDEAAPEDPAARDGAGARQPPDGAQRPAHATRTLTRLADRPPARRGRLGPGRDRRLQPGRDDGAVFKDPRHLRLPQLPAPRSGQKPGEKQPNRAALGTWGAWVNAFAQQGLRPAALHRAARRTSPSRPTSPASRKDFGDCPGCGWYERDTNPRGDASCRRQITEFANAGLIVPAWPRSTSPRDPYDDFDGFWGACSTYGSFSYLKYGPMRLFSQLAQDCELKVGKVLWVAGHSGPETAEDSRTHFGIFETGVTQLFPEGHVIDLHPWEYNEVPVVLGAALATDVPIVALHLTRPADRDPRPRGAGHPVALRGGARRVRHARLPAPGSRRWARSSCRARRPRPTSSRSCPSSTSAA